MTKQNKENQSKKTRFSSFKSNQRLHKKKETLQKKISLMLSQNKRGLKLRETRQIMTKTKR